MLILTRSGKEPPLEDILDGDQSQQVPAFVHNGQFFDPMLVKNSLGGFERRPLGSRNQSLRGHHLTDRSIKTSLELQVPVGDDPHQAAGTFDDRNA